MPRQLTLVIPLPPKECSPNCRAHYFAKAKAVKKYREQVGDEAGWARVQFGKELGLPWRKARILATFYHPAPNRRDPDNMLASLKAAFDGLRDARIIADDDRLTHLPPQLFLDAERPRVELIITEDGQDP